MPYETLIGWRYLFHRPSKGRRTLLTLLFLLFLGTTVEAAVTWFLSPRPTPFNVFGFVGAALGTIVLGLFNIFSVFISVSVLGVVLGVTALILVLSVTSGFQQQFRDKVLGVNAHVLVMKNSSEFRQYRDVEELARSMPYVVAVQPFTFVELLITRGKGELAGIAMKGVDPERVGTVLDLPQHMEKGSIAVLKERAAGEPPPIILGRVLAEKLKAKVGDQVTLVLPNLAETLRRGSTVAPPPKQRKFLVKGIFYSGFDEYDRRLAYVDIKEAQDYFGEGDTVTGVEMRLSDVSKAREVARMLEKRLGGDFYVVDWRELNNNLFTALVIQKLVLLVILTLIIIVAAFNMVASLTMLVVDKTKEIAILKSMGGSSVGVASVFQVVGLTIGAAGTLLGLTLGVAVGKIVAKYGYELDPKVYLIDRLPIRVNPFEVLLVGGIAMVVCFVATLYPALKASSLRPVEGLRYE